MKRITSIALFAFAALAAVGNLAAQQPRVQATIPFDFNVGTTPLPAGTYNFSWISSDIVLVRGRDNQRLATMTTTIAHYSESGTEHELQFHRYGGQYFLSEILSPVSGMSVDIPRSKLEKRVQMREASLQRNGQDVLLALK